MQENQEVGSPWGAHWGSVESRPEDEFKGEAVATRWKALRDVLRSRGIRSREDCAEWISAQGFPVPRSGHHFSGRV